MKSFFASILLFSAAFAFGQQQQSLGEVAAKYRAAKAGETVPAEKPKPQVPSQAATPAVPSTSQVHSAISEKECCAAEIEAYSTHIGQLLFEKKFAELDKIAHDLRVNKTRYSGGAWKLRSFYSGMESPRSGENAGDEEWMTHIAGLKEWTKDSPTSVTARIALANAYESYAWKARGAGYASSVRESDWQLFGERMQQAGKVLVEAEGLSEKDPEWFHAMMTLVQGLGLEPEIARGVVEKSREFEPSYYYPYRDLANFLLPKWYGEEGDSEKFAKEIADKIGGKLGDAMYAEIAPTLYCGCPNEPIGRMDFDRIVRGYAADEELYGVSLEKLNKLAYIAVVTNRMDVAKATFARLGDNWDKATWKVKRSFDVSKQVANGELPSAPAFDVVGRKKEN